jgi:glycosyltransferase involved in cell wall biosynthesis
MRMVEVVLHASTSPEPFGRVIVEGMLACRPVIATRAGGVSEILADGETGLMVPPGDVTALVSAMRIVLDRPDFAARLASAGRKHAERQFTVEAMVQAMTRNMEEVAQA